MILLLPIRAIFRLDRRVMDGEISPGGHPTQPAERASLIGATFKEDKSIKKGAAVAPVDLLRVAQVPNIGLLRFSAEPKGRLGLVAASAVLQRLQPGLSDNTGSVRGGQEAQQGHCGVFLF